MKYQVLFSLKNNAEIFMNVVCCSCDWPFKVKLPCTLSAIITLIFFFNRVRKLLCEPNLEQMISHSQGSLTNQTGN